MLYRLSVLFLLLSLSLSACQTATQTANNQPIEMALDQSFQLPFGQTATFAGNGKSPSLSITFFSVPTESRCPRNIQCTIAGEAVIQLQVKTGDGWEGDIQLSTMPLRGAAIAGPFNLQLQQLEPYPQRRGKNIPDRDYVATLLVSSIVDVPRASLDQPFQLKGGETVLLPDQNLKIKFVAMNSDSRCPANVNCVWSGEARIVLEVQKGTSSPFKVELSTLPDQSSDSVADYRIDLKSVEPYPETPEQQINFEDYLITLLVTAVNP